MTTTPEAARLVDEAKQAVTDLTAAVIAKSIVGAERHATRFRAVIDALAALSQPDEARDAARWRFVTSHAAEEQNEVAICGMGTFVGGGPQNGLRVWGASFGVDAEALVDAAMSKEQP